MRRYTRFSRATSSAAGIFCCIPALSACVTPTGQTVTSLSPAIHGDTLGYDQAFNDTSNEIILRNILRARDREPLNFSQLASVNGALNLSGTLGWSFPFGPPASQTTTDISTPSVTGGTSPTFTLTPLNTEGFTLNALQPVSATYVASQWSAGVSPQMLLMLFVKQIEFPADIGGSALDHHSVRFVNNPDDPKQLRAFQNLVDALLASQARLTIFDVLDPVGTDFELSGSTSAKNQPNTAGYSLVTSANDGQYHVGNAKNKQGSGQLYRVYSGQVAMCVNAKALAAKSFIIPSLISTAAEPRKAAPRPAVHSKGNKTASPLATVPSKAEPAPPAHLENTPTSPAAGLGDVATKEDIESLKNYAGMTVMLATHGAGIGAGQQPAAAASSKPAANSSSQSAQAASSSQATTAALQAGRLSSIVDARGCDASEIVLPTSYEEEFQTKSQAFVRIEWRSISEIFGYLGAVLRYNSGPEKPVPLGWLQKADPWVATDSDKVADVVAKAHAAQFSTGAAVGGSQHVLFQLQSADYEVKIKKPLKAQPIQVAYSGKWYYLGDQQFSTTDHTSETLAMLSTLVDLAKVSTDVTSNAPLRLLPLP